MSVESRPRHALIVGNIAYPNFPHQISTLNGVDKDVHNLNDVLISNAGFSQSRGGSTRSLRNLGHKEFIRALQRFLSTVKEGDDALFYYCGHGFTYRGNTFLVPVDAPFPITPANIESTCISLNMMKIRLSRTEARLKLFCIDACATAVDCEVPETKTDSQVMGTWCLPKLVTDSRKRERGPGIQPQNSPIISMRQEGPMPQKPKNSHIDTIAKLHESALAKNWYIITAAASEAPAVETTFGGGVFTNAFLRAIQIPDSPLGDLEIEVREEVIRVGNRGRKIQIPVVTFNTISREISKCWQFMV